jgi:phage-related protein
MLEKIIDNPDEVCYPLSRELYEDSKIVYHGTSSSYTEIIETKGWCRNDQPYEMNDIKFICELLESLDYRNKGYAILRPFTLGVTDYYLEKKMPSFTSDYWMARSFASVPGGETINALFEALNDFINILNSDDLKQKRINSLRSDFEKYDEFLKIIKKTDPNIDSIKMMYQKYKKALEMINNKQFLNDVLKKVLALKEKYESFVQNVYGVVYVVRVKPEWFKNWEDPFRIKNIHLRTDFLATTKIGPENIIAKIIFPKGITAYLPASNVPLPLPWAMEEFKKYVSDPFLPPNERFLKKSLLKRI